MPAAGRRRLLDIGSYQSALSPSSASARKCVALDRAFFPQT